MARSLIIPVSKSPNPVGRIGPTHLQDFYQICRRAVDLQEMIGSTADLVVVTSFMHDGFDEAAYLADVLKELGGQRIEVIRQGDETIRQMQVAVATAKSRGADLYAISSFLHAPRVWWLTRKITNVRRYIAFGIPRPWEMVTDVALALVFPFIDMFYGRRAFLARVKARRATGKL